MPSSVATDRFARQLVLPGFGPGAQQRIAAARIVVVGAGGLGSALLPVLVAAGVGEVLVVDDDVVDVSNLHRQTLYGPDDVGRGKAAAAEQRLQALAPGTRVRGLAERLGPASAARLAADATLLVDATDDLAARYALDDAAAEAGIPLVWGSATGTTGQVGVADAAVGPRWRDLFPVEPDPADVVTCAVGGVLPTLCTTVGGLMATEVLKLLTGTGRPLIGRMLVVDALAASVREVVYGAADPGPAPRTKEHPVPDSAAPDSPVPDFPVPSDSVLSEIVPGSHEPAPGTTPPGAGVHHEAVPDEIGPSEVAALLDGDADVQLVDVREPWEAEVASLPGATLIPLGELAGRLDELDRDRDVIAFCHGGVRSLRAMSVLRDGGFRVRSMAGGIDGWSRTVDPDVPRY